MKEKLTVIILLTSIDDTQDITIIKGAAIKLLGSLKTSTFDDNYLILFYNGILSEEEKKALSTKLQDFYSIYTLFLECSKEIIDKVKGRDQMYINANLAE